jgi:hypothetical protein
MYQPTHTRKSKWELQEWPYRAGRSWRRHGGGRVVSCCYRPGEEDWYAELGLGSADLPVSSMRCALSVRAEWAKLGRRRSRCHSDRPAASRARRDAAIGSFGPCIPKKTSPECVWGVHKYSERSERLVVGGDVGPFGSSCGIPGAESLRFGRVRLVGMLAVIPDGRVRPASMRRAGCSIRDRGLHLTSPPLSRLLERR